MSFNLWLSSFTLFEVMTTVLGIMITGVFSYMFYRLNKVMKVINYEVANGVPRPPPLPTRLPLRRYREHPRKGGDIEGLIATVRGLREFIYDVQHELKELEKDFDIMQRRVRESSDQIYEIDETLGEFRNWMKKTKGVVASQQEEITQLQERYRQHDADLEHIAFTPRKQVPNDSPSKTTEGKLSEPINPLYSAAWTPKKKEENM